MSYNVENGVFLGDKFIFLVGLSSLREKLVSKGQAWVTNEGKETMYHKHGHS